jgi:predicted MFS family arabinose efflux permease
MLWPRGGLWRHGDFLKLWSAETISQFGTQVSQLALPFIAIVVLDASPFAVAALGTVVFLPFLLFTLPAGVWVDRLPRRAILITADYGRALLLFTVPLAYAFDALTLAQLYVVGFLVGTFTVLFDVSYQSYLPSLVQRDQIIEGNSKLELSRTTAQITGPGLAGALIGLITAPYAVLVDAISFLGSGAFLQAIRTQELKPVVADGVKPRMRTELWEGLVYVVRHPLLRPQAMCTGVSNFFSSVTFSIFLVYAVRTLDLSAEEVGLILTLGGPGGLLGALLSHRITRRFGVGRTTVAMSVLWGGAGFLVPLAPQSFPHPYLVAMGLISSFAIVVYNIIQLSLRQAITPERIQGRMNSVMRFLVWGTIPLGSLTGGALASTIGLRETLFVGAAGGLLSGLPIILSRAQRTLGQIPEPEPEATTEAAMETILPAPFPHPKEP